MAVRIALVAPFGLRAKGTTRARVLPLAHALAGQGHETAVFIPPYDSPGDAGRSWREGDVAVVNVALKGGGSSLAQIGLAWRQLQAVRGWAPDVVHVFKPKGPSGLVGAALWGLRLLQEQPRAGTQRGGVPALVVDADDWEGPGGWNDDPRTGYSGPQKRFFAWQERYGLAHADAWTVASACLRERAVAFGATPDRIFVLHNAVSAVEPAPPTPFPAREGGVACSPLLTGEGPGVRSSASALLYTRFAGVRPAEVVAIWQRVRERMPAARLTVVGHGVGGEERELADVPGIEVAGWVEPDRLPALLVGASVAMVPWTDTPSNRARHSAKVLELMAAGLPVVAYAVGELPATLGDAGVLVPPGERDAFAGAVVDLLSDAPRGWRLGEQARARIRTEFTWEKMAEVASAAYACALPRHPTVRESRL